ncbi:hypothetical protein CDD83_9555 [Cordyceps sp. RAO-2017]|nr:hypothetical protein CDD83_9555 [Cordyceps sp. RAO-2017]
MLPPSATSGRVMAPSSTCADTTADPESQKLLPQEAQDDGRRPPETRRLLLRAYVWTLHLVALLLAVAVWSQSRAGAGLVSTAGRSWSPVDGFVEYEVGARHVASDAEHGVYAGPPSLEQEKAWDALVEPTYFNLSREELARAGESAEAVVEVASGGYLAALGVYHELHCLQQLRYWLYRDQYYPDAAGAQGPRGMRPHLDHCLETLRLTVMCRANTALYTFNWREPTRAKPALQSSSRSVCVKWSSVQDWAYSRKLPFRPPLVRLADAEPA